MKERFYTEVLIPLIEQAETAIRVFQLINETYSFDETKDQQALRRVYDELLILKANYDVLQPKEIQKKFTTIIRENHYIGKQVRGKSKVAEWAKVLRRISRLGRT